MIKDAVILAAGEGKRLRPFTETMPKVMLPVANKPILEYVIDAVRKSGIENIVIVVGYKKEVIQKHFKDYENITYVVQDKQLGTAHALLQAQNFVKDSFIVLAGDNIIDNNDISKLLKEKADFSIVVKRHDQPSKYGVVSLDRDMVKRIIEKPKEEMSQFISTGIYKFPKTVFKKIEELSSQGIHDLTSVVQSLIDEGEMIKAVFADLWEDVVYPWDLLDVNATMLNNVSYSLGGNIEKNVIIKGAVSIGRDSVIRSGCYIVGPVVIGENCDIGPNTVILPSTSIGDNSAIHSSSEIRNSIIMDEVEIGSHSFVSNSVVGKGGRIGTGFCTLSGKATVEVENEFIRLDKIGALIGEDTLIGSNVVVEPGIIIGRKCKINPLRRVIDNIPSQTTVM